MKKNLLILTLAASILAFPFIAAAQPPENLTLDRLINSVKSATWKIFGLIVLVCFVVAGALFLTAGGNPEKMQAARQAFVWGVAGVVVGLLAWSMLTLITALL